MPVKEKPNNGKETTIKMPTPMEGGWLGICGLCSRSVFVPQDTGKGKCKNCGAIVKK